MEEFVFPWHKQIVKTIHSFDMPAILHSCGNFDGIFDTLVSLGYDARHSYEDNICPVENAYDRLHPYMAVLGGKMLIL